MNVTAAIKARVEAKLKDGIARAEAKYNRKFSMPHVVYDLRGRTAGMAILRNWKIRLNAVLLMENIDDFIDRTVPHELAHLITDVVYPEAHDRSAEHMRNVLNAGLLGVFGTQRRIKRPKRDIHGAQWQSVCRVLGMTDITRCHSYDTTNSRVVKSNGRQIEWKCTGCGDVLLLTPKKSARLDKEPSSVWHRTCRRAPLVRVQPTTAAVDLSRYGAVMHSPNAPVTVPVQIQPVPTGVSKIEQCKKLYLKYSMLSRAEIIAKFVREAECTQAGAATYYATCKKMYG